MSMKAESEEQQYIVERFNIVRGLICLQGVVE